MSIHHDINRRQDRIPVEAMPPYPHTDEDTVVPPPENRDNGNQQPQPERRSHRGRNIVIGTVATLAVGSVIGGTVYALGHNSGEKSSADPTATKPSATAEAPATASQDPINRETNTITITSENAPQNPEKVDIFTSKAYTDLIPEQQAIVKAEYDMSYADFIKEDVSKTAIFSDVVSRAYEGVVEDAFGNGSGDTSISGSKFANEFAPGINGLTFENACDNDGSMPMYQIGDRLMTAQAIVMRGGSVELAKKVASGAFAWESSAIMSDLPMHRASLTDLIKNKLDSLDTIKPTTGPINDSDGQLWDSLSILSHYGVTAGGSVTCKSYDPSNPNNPDGNYSLGGRDDKFVSVHYGKGTYNILLSDVKDRDGTTHTSSALYDYVPDL